MRDNTEEAVDRLVDLLRLEREAIRQGEFDSLTDLAERKAAAMSALAGTPMKKLMTAQQMALENQRYLNAALKGVKAAQTRLQIILKAAQGFNSYDHTGRARAISQDSGTVERRA
ncbi:MAG: hypothetical protein IE922_00825 [Sphingomonadales bacterium]|nr:hypothetical protein [Sphingomonadales bacterium]